MKNTSLSDLRGHLFDVIERLKEGNDPEADKADCIDIDRAKTIAAVAREVIQSAKVEVDAMKILSGRDDFNPKSHMSQSGVLSLNENN